MPEYCPQGQPFRFAPGSTPPASSCPDSGWDGSNCNADISNLTFIPPEYYDEPNEDVCWLWGLSAPCHIPSSMGSYGPGQSPVPCQYLITLYADGEGPFYSDDPSDDGYDPMTGTYRLRFCQHDLLGWGRRDSACLDDPVDLGYLGLTPTIVCKDYWAGDPPEKNNWMAQNVPYYPSEYYDYCRYVMVWSLTGTGGAATLGTGRLWFYSGWWNPTTETWEGQSWQSKAELVADLMTGMTIHLSNSDRINRIKNPTGYPELYYGHYQTPYEVADAVPIISPPDDPVCCERRDFTTRWVQQSNIDGEFQGPPCLIARLQGVLPGKMNVARFGAGSDMPPTDGDDYPDLNPTVRLKHLKCSPAATVPPETADYWATRPASCLTPFPTHLQIWGVYKNLNTPSEPNEGGGTTYYFDYGWEIHAELRGEERIETEQQESPVVNTVVFKVISDPADLQRGPTVNNRHCHPDPFSPLDLLCHSGTFLGPPLKPGYFPITLTFDAENSTPYDSPTWRGPDYRNATVTIGVADCSFGGCNNPPVCTPLARVPAWLLTATDHRGNRRTRRMLPQGNLGVWKHERDPWQLFSATTRDYACLLRLLFSTPKYTFNFAWAIPSEADPCTLDDGDPWPMSLVLTEDIPLDPASREHYLACGLRPGTSLTASPWCDPDNQPPADHIVLDEADCLPATWTVTIGEDEYVLVYVLPADQSAGGFWRYPAKLDLDNPPPVIVTLVRIANAPGPPYTSRFALTYNADWNALEWRYETNLWARSEMADVDWDGGEHCCEESPGSGLLHFAPNQDNVEGISTEIEFTATPNCE